MAVNKLKAPRNIHIDFSPSPRQYELWKLLQPNYCPHCGAEIEQVLVGYDQQRNPQYKPQCKHCKSQNLPQLILGGGAAGVVSRMSAAYGSFRRVCVSRTSGLCLARGVWSADSNRGHSTLVVGIVFQEAIYFILRPFGEYVGYCEVVRNLDFTDVDIKLLGVGVNFKPRIFEDVVLTFQEIANAYFLRMIYLT